jgi:chromosome segregation ATPase
MAPKNHLFVVLSFARLRGKVLHKRETIVSVQRRRANVKPVKTIDDLIRDKDLSAEELEQHRELIEECRAREVQLKEYSRATRESMRRMTEELDKMSRTAEELWQEAQRLSQRVNGIYLHVAPASMRKVYH